MLSNVTKKCDESDVMKHLQWKNPLLVAYWYVFNA